MKGHKTITQRGESVITTISEGAIATDGAMSLTSGVGTNMVISGDGYVSIASGQGAVAIVADGGDLTLAANSPAGADVILQTNSTGEVSIRSTLKQYGTNGTITINNGSISNTGTMTMTASGGIATMSGLTGCVVTGGTGDVTLSGTNIFFSGEIDTTSGGLTVKANNGSSDVTITAPIAVGRSGQPGLTATGGSSSANGITVTGGSTDGYGIVSTGSGTGSGMLARSGSSGGYGLIAESIGTPAVRSSLRLVPQYTDPSSTLTGDIYVREKSGLISHRSAGTWSRVVSKFFVGGQNSIVVPADSSAEYIFCQIPANSLQAGSTVRIIVHGSASDPVGLPTVYTTFGGDTDTSGSAQLTNATNRFRIQSDIYIQSTTTHARTTVYDTLSLSTYASRFSNNQGTTFSSTNGVDVGVFFTCGEGGAVIDIYQFRVDISD